jgi:hypothetical protein
MQRRVDVGDALTIRSCSVRRAIDDPALIA